MPEEFPTSQTSWLIEWRRRPERGQPPLDDVGWESYARAGSAEAARVVADELREAAAHLELRVVEVFVRETVTDL